MSGINSANAHRKKALLVGALAVVFKLLITSQQLVMATPDFALLDDTLMYRAAQSITQGNWLGEYNWLTLGKHCFFPVWLALLHNLHIPYLLGGQLLQIFSSSIAAFAIAPLFKKDYQKLCCFLLLLYNPAASAALVELRIYRDNITPAITLLFFSGLIGYSIRIHEPLKKSIGFLFVGGIGLACCYLNREDGFWLFPFAVAASFFTLYFIITDRNVMQKKKKSFCLLIPYSLLAIGVLLFCWMNFLYYGRFIVSDFTSKEFQDAYGSLIRVSQNAPQPKVPVPYDTRQEIYNAVPEFAVLQPFLETDIMYNNYGSVPDKEFNGGGFYWAIREAAGKAGIYESPIDAKNYFIKLSSAVNDACNRGILPSGPPHSGLTPPIRSEHILPTLREGAMNFVRVVCFSQAQSYYSDSVPLQLGADAILREEYETFLLNKVTWIAQEGSNRPAYSALQKLCYAILEFVRLGFSALTPALFVYCAYFHIRCTPFLLKTIRQKNFCYESLLWLMGLGLLLCVFLRCLIVGFMSIAAFNDVEDIMYLCSAHPILLLYCFLGHVYRRLFVSEKIAVS